ncbi:Aspartate/ornithine carbamoyltransferase [Pavlovales sp. CCMP2436]|nr:Aspartate/ornithine carbamoyltransferase [Pavlovales sp. CCMP2436]
MEICHPLYGKSLVSIAQLDTDGIDSLFVAADVMKGMVKRDGSCELLKGKILANVFFEPSTRTMCSFAAAMLRLGGQVIPVNESSSSAQKGETLSDTIKCLE